MACSLLHIVYGRKVKQKKSARANVKLQITKMLLKLFVTITGFGSGLKAF